MNLFKEIREIEEDKSLIFEIQQQGNQHHIQDSANQSANIDANRNKITKADYKFQYSESNKTTQNYQSLVDSINVRKVMMLRGQIPRQKEVLTILDDKVIKQPSISSGSTRDTTRPGTANRDFKVRNARNNSLSTRISRPNTAGNVRKLL